jgi:hypothetical protein
MIFHEAIADGDERISRVLLHALQRPEEEDGTSRLRA